MPIKSTGCAKCRKRKIRCDETRPGCNRCKTHGVPCPGYRLPAPGEVRFHDQTEWTVLKAHERYGTDAPVPVPVTSTTTTIALRGKNKGEDGFGVFSILSGGDEESEIEMERRDSGYEDAGLSDSAGPDTPDFYSFSPHETNIDLATAMELFAAPPAPFLPSPALEKQLIYSMFLETYLPKSMPHRPRDRDVHFSIFEHLISSPGMRTEVQDALDALCLVQVGSTYKDKVLLKQSVGAYSKALRGLVRTLSRGDFVQDDYVLATCTMLSMCEFFDEIAQVGDGWSKHMDGTAQLMAARGPDSVQSDLALMLYSNMKHAALSHGLIARRACFLGLPEWRAVNWRSTIDPDASTTFYDLALQVPGLLEKHDKIHAKDDGALDAVKRVLQEAGELEKGLKTWLWELETVSKFRNVEGRLFWLTSVSNFPIYADLCRDRTIDEAFMFPGFMVAYIMSVYWDVMYFLRTTIQSLHLHRHELETTWFPDVGEAVAEEEIVTYVMNACRCFPFFCEPSSSSTGQIGMFLPMFVAATYFQRKGDWKMLKWLGHVRDKVFTRGMRPPTMKAVPKAIVHFVRAEESVAVRT